ncbi:MAG: phosphatase PAP2 family protein [Bacteroidota bacterium]
MLDALQHIDTILFYFINHTLQNGFFDFFMPVLTDYAKQKVVLGFAIALVLWMLIRGKPNIRLAAILLILTIVVSDQLNSFVIKSLFARIRPCHVLHDVHLLVGCGSGYSFPSSHAVNNFAGAMVLAFCIPRWRWAFFGFASLIAFSRVYVGVHYPFDVLGGALVGLCCAGFVITLYLIYEKILAAIRYKKYSRI